MSWLAEAWLGVRLAYRAGVYLTVDEFKGRRPIVRGGQTIPARLDGLRGATCPRP
jgi:hypothetical protein